jgi:hypothetical protein
MKLQHHIVSPLALAALSSAAFGQAQPYTFLGDADGEHLGHAVARAGDLDGDGVQDLIVGAPYSSLGVTVGGMARAYSGKTGAVLHTWLGATVGGMYGWSVSAAGDANNDGIDDVAIGEPAASPGGKVHIYSGSTYALIVTRSGLSGENNGMSVGGGLDVNLDGYDDVLAGTTAGNGKVRLYTGNPATIVFVLFTWTGDAPADFFGRACASAGDLDNDGFGDVVVGAPLNDVNGSGAGQVRAFSGRTGHTPAIWSWYGDSGADGLGESVAGAGDVDGDGWDDVIAGAPYDDDLGTDCGLARIWSGRTGAVIRTLHGDAAWLYFGTSVAGLGDIDGDGLSEVAVGGTHGGGAYFKGAVRVFSGATGAEVYTIYGDPFDAYELGLSAAHAGDLNGDGRGDLIAGASENAGYPGSARVFLSGWPASIRYCTAKSNSLGCPPRIEFSGAPSLSIADDFTIGASNVLNNKVGILIWSHSPAATPFGGGTLCLGAPITRTAGQASGGTPPPVNNCSGTYSYHFSQAYMVANGLGAGMSIYAQYWSRDTGYAAPNNVGLTDAVGFTICP